MNQVRKTKIISIMTVILLLSAATGLVLFALKQNINLFYTPTELLNSKHDSTEILRLGGYVKKNTVNYDSSGESVHFTVTDRNNEIAVYYKGLLPNLFREGQVVVVTGQLTDSAGKSLLMATQVLAKHDEKYMPRSIAKDLENKI